MAERKGIKSWPECERPRERLLKYGEHSLNDSELLAILLSSGTKGQSAVSLARKIIEKFGNFKGMGHTDLRTWLGLKGMGMAKIARIRAAIEIARRFGEGKTKDRRFKIKSSDDIAAIFMPRMSDLKKEVLKVLLLDSQNRIIEIIEAAEGTVNRISPIIREILHKSLEYFAASIICIHNHPSCNVEPSSEDIKFTESLLLAASFLDITVLDHVIIAGGKHFSFKDKGLIKFT